MKLIDKFNLEIMRQRVVELQSNPIVAARQVIGVGPDEEIDENVLKEFVEFWQERCRHSSSTFGDTYPGMTKDQIDDLILKGNFRFYMKVAPRLDAYMHEYLDILVVPQYNSKGQMVNIKGRIKLEVGPDSVNEKSCCGLGLIDPKLEDGILESRIDMTFGFNLKMYILKGMVTA